jgi:tetratricopeptide (TPR) repeat protein
LLIGAALIIFAVGALVINALRGNPAAETPAGTTAPGPALAKTVASASTPGNTPSATPSGAAALIDEAYLRLLHSDTSGAADLFQQALALEPDNPHALVGRAIAEVANYGDMKAAAADLDRAAQVIPDDPVLHFGRGLLSIRSDNPDAQTAEREFTQAIDTCGNNAALCAEAYYERSQLRAWTTNDVQGALADINRAIEVYPDPQSVDSLYASRADIRYQATSDAAGAIEDFRKAYSVSNSPDYLERAAAVAVRIKDYNSALELYAQLLKDQTGQPRYLAGRGYVEWQSGASDKAQQSADRALQLDPKLLEAHYLKGLLLLDANQPQEALAEFQPISTETNSDALSQMALPFLNTDFGHEIFYDMARAEVALGVQATAQEDLTQTLQRNDSWPEPYMLRAQILKDQGDLAGARENYLKALDYVSNDDKLKTAIEQALTDLTK